MLAARQVNSGRTLTAAAHGPWRCGRLHLPKTSGWTSRFPCSTSTAPCTPSFIKVVVKTSPLSTCRHQMGRDTADIPNDDSHHGAQAEVTRSHRSTHLLFSLHNLITAYAV